MKQKFFLLILFAILLFGCKKDNTVEPPSTSSDTTPPTIYIETPTTEPGFVTLNGNISFEGSASDDQGIREIRWNLNSTSGTVAAAAHWSVPSLTLQDGDNTFIITCTDNAGNKSADTLMVTKNKNISFLSAPRLYPNGIIVNESTPVKVTIGIQGSNINSSEVKVLKAAGVNNYTTLGNLQDNGDLANGDDIANDGVYSAIINFNESSTGIFNLRISAKVQGSNLEEYSSYTKMSVYRGITDAEFQEVTKIQSETVTKLNQFASSKDMASVLSQTKTWLLSQPEVSSVSTTGSTIIISYKNGLKGGILISEKNSAGEVTTKGGISTDTSRTNIKHVPLYKQTRGSADSRLSKINVPDPNIILDKDVLIYAPYENVFNVDMRPTLETIIKDADLGFKVTTFTNTYANILVLSNLTDYGLIILDTHGSSGEWILTGEEVTTTNRETYKKMIRDGELGIFTDVLVDKVLWFFDKKRDMYGVSSIFISSLLGTFPKSVIINGSCESTLAPNLENAFIGKGVKTYYGFNKVVNTTFCRDVSDVLVSNLVKDLKTTSNSFTAGQIDPQSPNAVFQMKGNGSMYFSSGLINGDFEMGTLDAWSTDGDGRVITQLGSVNPTGTFMGIISTGLGFTTATGSISQSFKVKDKESNLSIRWNFLSEEFLEFINTQYQDYFTITIKKKTGEEIVLLNKTIDNIASDFGASKENPGNLISVSPGIKFDRGGVYMTGWITSTFDLTQYRGQSITLNLKAGDVGDSIFDTAILLDEIIVQ